MSIIKQINGTDRLLTTDQFRVINSLPAAVVSAVFDKYKIQNGERAHRELKSIAHTWEARRDRSIAHLAAANGVDVETVRSALDLPIQLIDQALIAEERLKNDPLWLFRSRSGLDKLHLFQITYYTTLLKDPSLQLHLEKEPIYRLINMTAEIEQVLSSPKSAHLSYEERRLLEAALKTQRLIRFKSMMKEHVRAHAENLSSFSITHLFRNWFYRKMKFDNSNWQIIKRETKPLRLQNQTIPLLELCRRDLTRYRGSIQVNGKETAFAPNGTILEQEDLLRSVFTDVMKLSPDDSALKLLQWALSGETWAAYPLVWISLADGAFMTIEEPERTQRTCRVIPHNSSHIEVRMRSVYNMDLIRDKRETWGTLAQSWSTHIKRNCLGIWTLSIKALPSDTQIEIDPLSDAAWSPIEQN